MNSSKMTHFSNDNLTSIPHEVLISEGISQKDRLLKEVMECLFASLPEKTTTDPSFLLSDGTQCFLKKFFAPRKNADDETIYGFDVVIDNGPLSHLEFVVKCSGWERSITR